MHGVMLCIERSALETYHHLCTDARMYAKPSSEIKWQLIS